MARLIKGVGEEMKIVSKVVSIILVLTFSWYMWQIGKLLSYKFMYKNMVQQTVTDMVKPECLIN